MRLVIVTGHGPEHKYVANTIAQAHEPVAILTCSAAKPRPATYYLSRSPLKFLDKAARSLFLRAIGDRKRRAARLHAVLGPSSQAFNNVSKVEEVGAPKAGRLYQRLQELQPDVLAIYGTSIIPDDVLSLARVVAINMHTGLSPWYRGVACALWPLANKELDMLGATVHECTADVDGGRIFMTSRVQLQPGDGVHDAFARVVKAGADSYAAVIHQAMSGALEGQPQDMALGHEYKGATLGLAPEIRARWHLWQFSQGAR